MMNSDKMIRGHFFLLKYHPVRTISNAKTETNRFLCGCAHFPSAPLPHAGLDIRTKVCYSKDASKERFSIGFLEIPVRHDAGSSRNRRIAITPERGAARPDRTANIHRIFVL
jgi:hypothetical protein